MGKYVDKAVDYHKGWNSCSVSVLSAFSDVINITPNQASRIASPMGSGMMGTCGALLAAEYVLEALGKDKNELHEKFFNKVGDTSCTQIRRQRLQSCRQCVIDAATMLEEILEEE